MAKRPRLKAHLHAEALEGEGLILFSEGAHTFVEGALSALVLPYLDGRFTPEEIIVKLNDRASRPEILAALQHMEECGYLTHGDPVLPPGEEAWWAGFQIDPELAARRLAEGRVVLRAIGNVGVGPIRDAFQSLGVREDPRGAFTVVITDDYLRGGLAEINRESLDSGRSWLLARPTGSELWLGPLFQPEMTGCWECLAGRLRTNRPFESLVRSLNRRAEPIPVPPGSTPAGLQVAANLLALKVSEWVVRGELPDLAGRVATLDLRTMQGTTHRLAWQPHCPACGDPADEPGRGFTQVELRSRRKPPWANDAARSVPPEVMLESHAHHVSPITGHVTMLERVGLSTQGPQHSYTAGYNPAFRRSTPRSLREGFRNLCSGKGTTDLQARASALGEALERSSSCYRGDEPRIRARFVDLAPRAIHPNECMRFSEEQYRGRDRWNSRGSRFNVVPEPFVEDAIIDWTPVSSLTIGEHRYLPTAFCYFNHPRPTEAASCVACSNGNAAGSTLEEAILHGFLELVERDAVALWWYNRLRRPEVDLSSFQDPYLETLAAFLRQRGRDLHVLDLTSDLEIPTFAAVSRCVDSRPEEILFGFGSHFSPRAAVLRAVTEFNQFHLMLSNPSVEDPSRRGFVGGPDVEDWLETATIANQPHLAPDPHAPRRRLADFRTVRFDDFRDDVLYCRSLVEDRGMEFLVLDLTRPDIGLPVVKVIVPGLRHFWARFGPGRLFDVPARLGWLPGPLAESELNPVPMFI
ncbi:TOMM precursor leader peptide-binding protein [Aquisphaera insulae]|uniref:TOMM precursor leader peptide-binding protein n=1 Tax=Aquisphaera insulae TaxID=2712864 RepID=UPI0013EC8F83|nr:TOMM precursor leader peptide-binding protein [Aquisphaera insulae]